MRRGAAPGRPRAVRRSARFLVALLFLACATNPVTGRREFMIVSPEQEAALGKREAQKVEEQIGLVRSRELEAYVDAIGQRLARHSPRAGVEHRFAVADMPEPNAFALPGGYIYVSRGLLVIANSEAELANVIGHEIGHVAARHHGQRQTRATGLSILSAIGTITAAAAGGAEAAQAAAQLGQVAGAGLIASYGRDQERQSDDVGQSLAARAGWDPMAMADFLRTLERYSVLRTGEKRLPSFLDSHPLTSERIDAAAARARSLPMASAAPIAPDRRRFLAYVQGIRIGADPAEGVFRDGRFLHPGLDFAIDFPAGWETQNTKTAVAARSADHQLLVVLEGQGPPGDPRVAAQRFAEENRLELSQGGSLRIGGFSAYRALARAQSRQGELILDLTWLAHPKLTFRITGMAPAAGFEAAARTLRSVAMSFRPLARQEREGITERRLQVVRARAGESLASLSRRTGNRWDLEETAVANGISPDARLRAGDLLKIAVEVPLRF